MNLLSENTTTILSLLFGTGGIGYAVISRLMDRKKYTQEVRCSEFDADIKSDEFWKKRYDVLNEELISKDGWWKERYDNLYSEFQNERQLSNELVKSFRTELNEIRNDYDRQREIDKQKYDNLMLQYRAFEEESKKQENVQIQRISQLEKLVAQYEKRLNIES